MIATKADTRRRRRWPRAVASVFVVCGIATVVVLSWPTIVAALGTVTSVHPAWLVVAELVEVVSVLGTTQLQRVMLAAAGAPRPGLRDHLGTTYVAAAVSGSLPGGTALATAYTYRQLRARGVTRAHTGWTLTASGVFAAATMALVTTVLLTLHGGGTTSVIITGAVEMLAAAGLLAGIRWATRHPAAVFAAAMWCTNKLDRLRARKRTTDRERRAQTDPARVAAVVAVLTSVRIRPRHAVSGVVWGFLDRGADVACLGVCLLAVGLPMPSPAALFTAYVAGVAAGQLSLTPAGAGLVEAAITGALIASGTPAHTALAAVLVFRMLSPGLNTVIGALVGAFRPRIRPGTRSRSGLAVSRRPRAS